MRRREWLRGVAGLSAGFVVSSGRLADQTPAGPGPKAPRDTAAALGPPQAAGDRLYDPSAVQERAVATGGDNDPAVKELEHRLKCTCGCNLDVYTCRTTDFTCTYSPSLHKEVLALRAEGKDEDAVIAAFVAKYGEQVLMAPKPVGFNLAGYLLPGGLVALAGTLLAVFLLRRGRHAPPEVAPVPGEAVSGADAERLRRALADLED